MAGSVLQVRIDDELRKDTSEIFHNLGLDMSSAVRLFLNRVVVEQGLPFPMVLQKPEKEGFNPVEFLTAYKG